MLHPVRAAAAVASVLVLGAAGVAAGVSSDPATAKRGPRATAQLRGADGALLGTVRFSERRGTTQVDVRGVSLPPGFHGFHVHDVGVCEAPTFTSAGGHYVGGGGANHAEHAGDLPVLLVRRNGGANTSIWTDRFRVGEIRGKAVIVHAAADNYANIPPRYGTPDADTLSAGDSGGRIACGVIR